MNSYNNSPHRSLGSHAPVDALRGRKEVLDFIKKSLHFVTPEERKQQFENAIKLGGIKLFDFVQIKTLKKSIFDKASEIPVLSTEIFRVTNIRFPNSASFDRGCYYSLTDTRGEEIRGKFDKISNLVRSSHNYCLIYIRMDSF